MSPNQTPRNKPYKNLILGSFLAESKNGPHLCPSIGHEHIAFACVSHLIQLMEFVQPEVERDKKMVLDAWAFKDMPVTIGYPIC